MSKFLLVFGIVLALCTLSHAQDLYDVSIIHNIQITFPQSNWDRILDSLYAIGEDRLLGAVVIDGIPYDSVGIRYKGTSTYNPARAKNPFNIKLDYIRDDQKHQGYGTLKLANSWFDPSFVREVLSYEIARKYMAAGLASYANVYVNGTLMGLYVNVQNVDKLFTRTHFNSGGGARIKGEILGPPQTYVVWGYEGEDSSNYMDSFELDSDAGWTDLIDFLDTLNNHTAVVDKVLDVDRHLWMIAFDNLLVNLDAPINFAHNYYLYRDDSRRFNPIIWDLNTSFGGFTTVVGVGNLNVSQMRQLSPFLNESNANYPILNKFLQDPTYRKMYVAHMKTMIMENFSNGWYHTRGSQLQSLIAPSVQADVNKYSSYSSFLNNLTSQVGSTPGLTQLMSARTSYLLNHPAFTAVAPTIASINHAPAIVPANDTIVVTVSVTNATNVILGYRDNEIMPFTKAPMLDDGAHSDGMSGDGVYGIKIPVGNSNIHYYIYAENADAGCFMPPRAEFEDSVIAVTAPSGAGIVINEFQADNASTVTDQDNEYEDWVELYNTTAFSVSLGGFHLSDKTDNVGKWTFPDTSIAPHAYLTVWLDEDAAQAGLHANFKLSAGGEAIVFSNPALTVLDQVVFGAQTTDMSSSRCPDGVGPFSIVKPSFASLNACSQFTCGDADGDLRVATSDVVQLVNYLFAGGSAPIPMESGDVDCNSQVSITDCVFLINYIFAGGAAPCAACQ